MLLYMLLLQPQTIHQSIAAGFQIRQDTARRDTAKVDSIPPYVPTKTPTYKQPYRFGDPYSNPESSSAFILMDPSAVDASIEMHDSTINYSIYENMDSSEFRPAVNMTFEQYNAYDDVKSTKEYFQERSAGMDAESATTGRNLIPKLYISPVLDRLFGGSYVDIQPTGLVNLDFGGTIQRVDNPTLSRQQQYSGGFNFNQQISLNLVGKIGEKLAVTANFDNNNTFDFQNNMKVGYTGFAEDIIKTIEVGNVSMPSSNSLITGSQSLFGIKTQLQFGKLFLTGVISRQQGETETLTIEGGASTEDIEIQAYDYDVNRHFFLGHFFYDHYEDWYDIPKITSGITINQVEVYVVNNSNDTETTREIVGLMDLGEGSTIYADANSYVIPGQGDVPNANDANSLYTSVTALDRSSTTITASLENLGLESGTDFLKISSARKLDSDEFTIHSELGYITLLSALSNDEMLAVAYEYSYNGQTYKVGEITSDYSSLSQSDVIFMKLLRPNKVDTSIPTWDLMMKNIYSLDASNIEEDDFTLRVIYRDDASGIDNPSLQEGTNTKDKPLIRLLGLDALDQNEDHNPDGNFDFVDGVTIDADDGYVIFPVVEPFGSALKSYFLSTETSLISKYVYNELYEETQSTAQQETTKDKFYLTGEMTSSTSNVISLSGVSIAENSVTVTAGGTTLTEGTDYTVNYSSGYITILNDGVLSSGKTITITYEKSTTFSTQTRWLFGARAEYRFNDNFIIGGTIMQLKEQQGNTSRYAIGSEPTSNTMYGFDVNYKADAPYLTKALDFLPLISTKEASTLTFKGEFAQILPATSNTVDGEQAAYIDDFESASTSVDISGWSSWKLAATPKTSTNAFLESSTGWQPNYRRAKIAWYTIDQSVFYSTSSNTPTNITSSDLENQYERAVEPKEIYREQDYSAYVTPLDLFDIAYFPNERGQYNYNPSVDENGLLNNPKKNYGGITRAITSNTDFDNANIQYIQFWLMDPFISGTNGRVLDGIYNDNNTTGGKLIINLGNVSEDVVPDETYEFESGYPSDGDLSEVIETDWGRAPSSSYLTSSFDNSSSARKNQDIGLDGLSDDDEPTFFSDFLNDLTITGDALTAIQDDPSSDDYNYFLGSELDDADAKIVQRYKDYNGLEGNTPYDNEGNNQGSTTKPDNEDLNSDNTLSDTESYYEYEIDLEPGGLEAGDGYIVDQITSEDGEATWYQFRVPIRSPDNVYGSIDGYTAIKYVRMYLTNFSQPVVLRTSELEFVSSTWRKYEDALNDADLNEIPETTYSDFTLSFVNVEENSTGTDTKSPYVLPPGISRDTDNSTGVTTRVNEQSIQICIEDLDDQDARAVYKTVDYNLRNYGKVKMFLHAEAYDENSSLEDDEVTAFMRFGTDYTENYYEIELPLKITPAGVSSNDSNIRREVWPEDNEMNFSIDELTGVKSERNLNDIDTSYPYKVLSEDSSMYFTVMGNPDISSVQVIMIGVRNPKSEDGAAKSVCMWADELRVTDFNNTKGWAVNSSLNLKLADVATVSMAAKYTSIGWGTIDETASERAQEETLNYDVSANVNVDKFLFPEKTGLKVPMYVSLEKTVTNPKYDPLNPDITLESTLAAMDTEAEREKYRHMVQERTEERSLNFTNVHKEKVNPDAKAHFYDLENLSLSYSYNEEDQHSITYQALKNKEITGEVAYNYSPRELVIAPFANSKGFKKPIYQLIKDMNLSLLPSSVGVSMDVDRTYEFYQLYNDDLTTDGIDPYYETAFTLTRNYNVSWKLFNNLSLSYTAKAYALIDEPDSAITGEINTDAEKSYIWNELKHMGRMKTFDQDISATYSVPLSKFPLTDWLGADLSYSASYEWVAGSQVDPTDTTTSFYGNTLSNDRQRGINGKVDMEKLYNKVKYLKTINNPKRTKKGEEQPTSLGVSFLRFLMALRSVNMKYTITEATTLEGFKHKPHLFGMDSSWNSPGWGFILGDQDPNIRYKAAKNGWLVENSALSDPFTQSYTSSLSITTSVEPSDNFSIQFSAQQTNTSSYSSIFRWEDDSGFTALTPSRSGSYSVTFMSLPTAFEKKGAGHSSKTFDKFLENVYDVETRLTALNPNGGAYSDQSQDVLIPAFIEAYSGQHLSNSKLTPIPKIPMPAWTVEYKGLTKIKALAAKFSAISLTHSYKSTYAISSYSFNSSYYGDQISDDFDVTVNYNLMDYPMASVVNDTGLYVPVYTISTVTISEQFSPLLGVSVSSKNNISASVKYNKTRSLSLGVSNAQIAETNTNDLSMSFGYTKEKFNLPFKSKGRTITLQNALTSSLSLSLKDTETVQRLFDGTSTLTAGSTILQYRPAVTYKLNESLDLTFYFQRSVTVPKVSSSSYKTVSTSFGTQLKFSLSQ